MEHRDWTFLCGCAPFSYFGFFGRERDDLADQEIAATTFFVWYGQAADPERVWGHYNEIVSWRAQGIATVKPSGGRRTTIGIGSHGQYFEVDPENLEEYTGEMGGARVILRALTSVGSDVVAVGMGRTARRREARGRWSEFGPGITSEDEDRVVGFEDVDGFSMDDLYAVGWGGEIWRWTGAEWEQVDSPTNANLNAVVCASNGSVYAVGDNGALVRGTGGSWEVIDTGRPENLQDVTEFGGDVFVSTDFKILRLTGEGLVPDDRFADPADLPGTCLALLRAADGVVSMGPKDLFSFTDGVWRRVI